MRAKTVVWIAFLYVMFAFPLLRSAMAYYHDDIPLDVIKAQAQLSKEAIETLSEDLKLEEEMLSWGINVKATGDIQRAKMERLPSKEDLLKKLKQQFPDFFSHEIDFLSQDIEKDRFIIKLNRWVSHRRRLARGKIRLSLPEKRSVIAGLKEKLISLEESIEERMKK